MKISSKGRYALQMLLDLAERRNDGYIALKDIAERRNISKKYLEQIVPILTKSNMLQTIRGYQGGYKLAKSPDKYTVGDILRLTEGSLAPISCPDQFPDPSMQNGGYATLSVWQGLSRVINEYLDSVTLQDILNQQNEQCAYNYII